MSYESALEYIQSVRWQGSKPGLSRTRELLDRLGNPENSLKFVHVAGTNGKGSTCAVISSVLRRCGLKVGLFTSPHIVSFNERMQINGVQISDAELEELIWQIQPVADAMEDSPTEFEMTTAIMLLFFQRNGCDICVLETGMGGEMDSTNVIPAPEAAVLTAIALDHTQYLGNTLPEIALTKAGIIKPGCSAVAYPAQPEVEAVHRAVCSERGVELTIPDLSSVVIRESGLDGITFDFGSFTGLRTPLPGLYQPMNAAVAISCLQVLREKGWPITDKAIYEGLASVSWPGRFEVLGTQPPFVLDGAHNPHGITATAESLRQYFPQGGLVFLTGVMADKDFDDMYRHILPLAKAFVCTTPDNPRALPAQELAAYLQGLSSAPAYTADTVEQGVSLALELAADAAGVCALGSLYFSAEVRRGYEAAMQ